MIDTKFNEYNKLFKSIITENDLSETYTLIDNESILSRIYKKN